MIELAHQGAVAFHILLAGLLTLVLGVVLLVLYRRAVSRWMGTSARRSAAQAEICPLSLAPPASPLAIEEVNPQLSVTNNRLRSPTMRDAAAAFRRAALVYALAGLVHALTATTLQVLLGAFAFAPVRFTTVVCANAWPIILTLALFWGPDRRRQLATIATYAAVLAAVAIAVELGGTPPLALGSLPGIEQPSPGTEALSAVLARITLPAFAQPLFIWFIYALPTVYLLLVLNRRVRAIGPVLLVAMLIGAAGIHLATVFMGSDLGFAALGRAHDLTGVGAVAWFYGLQVVAFALFLVPAWHAVRWLARRYIRKRISDQMLVFDAVWLFATLLLCQRLVQDAGPIGWTGLLAFVAYKLVTRLGHRPLAAAAERRPPARLLLLRVFGFQRRTERFFAILSARWRYAGSIQLIAANDLAAATIEPGEFLDFLSGRLRRLFIHNRADLDRRLAQMDVAADPDGRFRINEFFCTEDTWREAATRLMGSSHFVVMDLRGFSPANKGCLFELQALLDGLPLARLALLVDRTTDLPFLETTLGECWQRLAAASPNRSEPAPRLRLLRTKGSGAAAVRSLLALADAALAPAER